MNPDGLNNAGVTYVVFGKASGFGAVLELSTLNGSNGSAHAWNRRCDNVGSSVSTAGDVNGDGFDDLIVGALNADPNGQSSAGEVYVVFGKAGGFAAAIELSSLTGTMASRSVESPPATAPDTR